MDSLLNTNTALTLAAVLGVGPMLGAFYFIALWVTVKRLSVAEHPVCLMLASFTLRVTIVMSGFYLILRGDRWELAAAALMGFVLIKLVLTHHFGRCKTA